ncbi:hypothetical protein L3X38_000708 [Prunus dulcis]|uniref:GRF-type domain-containing protein n=1 Tax=Prunus dulcis TaxID=3755 RepID=A0AAD4WT17_PRUDU|nr:hypothetical protein L3X38_000708 [Prunus dulcis]
MSTRSMMSANRRCEVGQPIFQCGNQCRLTTSWTNNNPGRRFWGCADYGVRRGCAFFEWYDPQVCERSKIVICGLLKRLRKEEEENQKSKKEVGAALKAQRFLRASVLGSWIFLIVLLGMLVLEWKDSGFSKNVKLALTF